ncbi:MAG TPA: hypothetical protein VEA69_00725 [Tepidisphaeraceae bacterium]|nr:hypothetical protein [Tepidisphaeraceae bacterium]
MSDLEALVKSVLGPEARAFEYRAAGRDRTGWRLYVELAPFELGQPRDTRAEDLVEESWRALHARGVALFVGPSVFRVGPDEYADSWGTVTWDPDDGPPTLPDPSDAPPTCAQVFALPGADVLDVVEFCRVGSHNAPAEPYTGSEFLDRMREQEHLLTPEQREMMRMMEADRETRRTAANRMPHGHEPWRMVQAALADIRAIVPFAILSASEAGLSATLLEAVDRLRAARIGQIIMDVDPDAMELPRQILSDLGLPIPIDPQYSDVDHDAAMTESILATGQFRMWWD